MLEVVRRGKQHLGHPDARRPARSIGERGGRRRLWLQFDPGRAWVVGQHSAARFAPYTSNLRIDVDESEPWVPVDEADRWIDVADDDGERVVSRGTVLKRNDAATEVIWLAA